MRARVTHRDPEMVIRVTDIVRDIGAGFGKHENPGLAVTADLVVHERRTTVGSVDERSREGAVGGATTSNRAGGVEDIHRRVLVAADVAERDTGYTAIRDALEVQRPSPPAEDLHVVPSSPDQLDRPLRDEDFVLVEPGPDKDLIIRL